MPVQEHSAKPRIFHLITDLNIGGTEHMLLRTLPRLSGWTHIVCSLTTIGAIGRELQEQGIRVIALEEKKLLRPSVYRKVVRLLRKEKPGILQTYLAHADIIGRFAGKRAGVERIVCSIRSKLHEARFLPMIAFYAFTSPLVDDYLFNSHTIAAWYKRRGIPQGKITVIPNGLEVERFTRTIDREAKRRSLGIKEDALVIGCVAKLRREKGHVYLLEALKNLVKTYPRAVLLLVGGGPLEGELQQSVASQGLAAHVRFLGDRVDIPELLQIFDVFVLPTLYEGMSNTLLEAMAAGLPIVTTDIPENRELIHGGEHGILVPVKSAERIQEAVSCFIEYQEGAQRFSRNARGRVVSVFQISKTIEQLGHFYRGYED